MINCRLIDFRGNDITNTHRFCYGKYVDYLLQSNFKPTAYDEVAEYIFIIADDMEWYSADVSFQMARARFQNKKVILLADEDVPDIEWWMTQAACMGVNIETNEEIDLSECYVSKRS